MLIAAAVGGCAQSAPVPRQESFATTVPPPLVPATPAPPATPATRPGTAAIGPPPAVAVPQTFDDPKDGIRFVIPAGWTPQCGTSQSTTRVRVLAPPGGDGWAVLTLDVPPLPPHIPGLIPVGMVASGYVDDEKKRIPDVTGPAPVTVTVPDARARRVALAGHDAAGAVTTDEAVVIVHADRIYILSVDAGPGGQPAARAALDAALASIAWTD